MSFFWEQRVYLCDSRHHLLCSLLLSLSSRWLDRKTQQSSPLEAYLELTSIVDYLSIWARYQFWRIVPDGVNWTKNKSLSLTFMSAGRGDGYVKVSYGSTEGGILFESWNKEAEVGMEGDSLWGIKCFFINCTVKVV